MGDKNSCGFDTLFNKHLPHIVEKIFLSLDYESLKTCYEVSNKWKEFIISDSFQKRAKDTFSSDIEDDEMYLCEAANTGDTDEIRSILSYGLIDVNYVGWIYARTALHEASQSGHNVIAKILLDHGADPNIVDEDNWQTPLHIAAASNHKEVSKTLLDNGAEPNKADRSGETPLHGAAYQGFGDIVKILLEGGADPNVGGEDYVGSPLFFAVLNNEITVVKTLLDAGADPNLGNEQEYSPLGKARQSRYTELAQILEDAGAEIWSDTDEYYEYK